MTSDFCLHSLSGKTFSTYASATAKFLTFYAWFTGQPAFESLDLLPASATSAPVASAFIAWAVSINGMSPEGARSYYNGVRTMFKLVGLGPLLPVMKGSIIALVIRGAKNAFPERRALPKRAVTTDIITPVLDWVRLRSPWSPLTRAFFTAIALIDVTTGHRLAELLYDNKVQLGATIGSFHSIDTSPRFDTETLPQAMLHSHRGPWTLTTFDMKNRKRCDPFISVVVNVDDCPALCPATALRNYWGLRASHAGVNAGWTTDSHFFVDDRGKPWTTDRFRVLFTQALSAAGIPDPRSYTPHGMRVGLSSTMAALDIPADLRASIIGWAAAQSAGNTTMLSRYTRLSLERVLSTIRAVVTSAPVTLLEHTTATRRASGQDPEPARVRATVHFQ